MAAVASCNVDKNGTADCLALEIANNKPLTSGADDKPTKLPEPSCCTLPCLADLAAKRQFLPTCIAKKSTLLRKVVAETIGTFVVVFTGCGAVMVDEQSHGQISHLGVSLAFGIVVMIVIYSIGHISGAHINPAVTIAFAVVRHFPWSQVPIYIGSQLVGAISASFALRATLGSVAEIGATIPAGTAIQSFIMEFIISFILMFVVSAVATDSRAIGELAGLAVGSTVCLNAIFAGPVSGASMNPARSIGPAIVAGHHGATIWVYIVGPIVGTLAGALSYKMVQLPESVDLGSVRSSRSFRGR